MLQFHSSDHLEHLADGLGALLCHAPADPMEPEWIATPTQAMHRWLSLRLSRSVGASDRPDATDGIAANITAAYPGSLLQRVIEADQPDSTDSVHPWHVDRLAWSILEVLEQGTDNPVLDRLARSGAGSRYSRARRIADLFDRYNLHRPAMIRAWASGDLQDGRGAAIPHQHFWQPSLWNLVRHQIGTASPAERMPEIIDRLHAGDLPLDLPARLTIFGLTVVPGGPGFLELAAGVAAHRDVHLFFHQPSPPAFTAVFEAARRNQGANQPDPADLVHHPLLCSWARPALDTAVVLGVTDIAKPTADPSPPKPASSTTILTRLQTDLRGDLAPAAEARTLDPDRSIEIHACYGATRQVEALRDTILGALAHDPTLTEDQIAVMTPDVERFAPIVEAVFGPSADDAGQHAGGAPPLRYRTADRSIRSSVPILSALSQMLELATSRFDVASVLDFLASAPVRQRLQLGIDDLHTIRSWADATNVRWGLNPQHRAGHGVSAEIRTNTWQSATDRLLLGSSILTDSPALAIGDVVPEGIEASEAALVGRLANGLKALTELAESTSTSRPISEWLELLLSTSEQLFEAPVGERWQAEALQRVVGDISDSASTGRNALSDALLEFDDLRRLITSHLDGAGGRSDFFRGGITISSLMPLRSIPHRVICLLGIEQSSFGRQATDGDDLVSASSRPGDPDPRGEARQSLLEAALAADDRLVIFRDGHDVRTNVEIPRATVLDELVDALGAMVAPEHRDGFLRRLEISHPRQPFDEKYFIPGELIPDTVFGFDPDAHSGAVARRSRADQPFDHDLPSIPTYVGRADSSHRDPILLSNLRAFFANPTKHFVDLRVEMKLHRPDDDAPSNLPVELDSLQRWKFGDALIESVLGHDHPDPLTSHSSELLRHAVLVEHHRGLLPTGGLGDLCEAEVSTIAESILDAASLAGVRPGAADELNLDLVLPSQARIVGPVSLRLAGVNGPANVTFSKWKPKTLVATWLDLMCLVAADPGNRHRAIQVCVIKGTSKKPDHSVAWEMTPVGDSSAERRASAISALEVAADCYERGSNDPVPIFPKASFAMHLTARPESQFARDQGGPGSNDSPAEVWSGGRYLVGDSMDAHVDLVYGPLSFEELCSIPTTPHDPEPMPGRPPTEGLAERFASYLWDAIHDSIEIHSIDLSDGDQ